MHYTTDGLVIREVNVGENDKLLTLLTPDRGKMSVMAKGTRSVKSKMLGATQLYTYGNYEIYEKNDYNWLKSGSIIEGFFGLRNDIETLSLAAYIADLAAELTGEETPESEMLRMTLNAFYALANGKKSRDMVKAVYELRSASISGFMPELSGCRYCHRADAERMYLDVMNGRVICSECMMKRSASVKVTAEEAEHRSILLPINASVLAAVRYAVNAPMQRMLAFELKGDEEMTMFSKLAEEYLLNHLERGFSSLEFYKSLLSLGE